LSKDTGFSITSAERYSLALFELSEENNLLSQIEVQSSFIKKKGTLITKRKNIRSNKVIRGISFTKSDAKITLIG